MLVRALKIRTVRCLSVFARVIVFTISLVEAPIFLLLNQRIFKNEIVYVFWHWSFGHTISGLDYASRLYYPHRVSLIYIPHPRSNRFLHLCFKHNMDAFIYKSLIPPQGGQIDMAKYDVLRFFVLLLSGISKRLQVIEQRTIYKTLSVAECEVFSGSDVTGRIERYDDWTGYLRLLREGIGRCPVLPREEVARCREAIVKSHPGFFDRPFVTLLLREKGKGGAPSDTSRCCGPQENYVEAVRYLTRNGYNVVGTGETRHAHFEHIPGYVSLDHISVPGALLNLFLLTQCSLFIGQQSGPHVLPNSCGILCVICDAMPYRIGTFRSQDLLLFKHIRLRASGKVLSVVEVFTQYIELAYGLHLDGRDVEIEPNTSEEILEAIMEGLLIIQGQLKLSDEDRLLCDKFGKLPSKGMPLVHHGNRTPLAALRRMKPDLLRLPT